MPNYYFAFRGSDPIPSKFSENEMTLEDMRKRFVGQWIQTGDEPHDCERINDIWTKAQVEAYYNN
jgi:hypothetical protein